MIEAMLGLDVDVKSLLPKDVSRDGDNIAAVLLRHRHPLEQYIQAAPESSGHRQCTSKSSTREYRGAGTYVSQNSTSTACRPERGGIFVDYYFPADGEYALTCRLSRGGCRLITKGGFPPT